jgi:hypothetical protein
MTQTTDTPSDWWHRPRWPFSRLSPWQGWWLRLVPTVVLIYFLNRTFSRQQDVVMWGVVSWLAGRNAVKLIRHRK